MYKKILVALDGTQSTESVIDHVVDIARAENSEVVLLNVLPEPRAEYVSGIVVTPLKEAVERSLAKAQDYLRGMSWRLELHGIKTKHVVRLGDPAEEIIKCADLHEVDLIAMVPHKRRGLDRIFHSSVSHKVMRSVPTPMLLLNAA
ncbi:MAG: universal stress protein [Chloroflexi bacterium]|nr:universal stress protein [Chloroflexota bacterium]MDA8188865.1 universal stress protein [Dehalococcoidales bacterium]